MLEPLSESTIHAWLLCRSGSCAGVRFPLRARPLRIGRAADNDVVVDGPDAATVSSYHCEIETDGAGFRVRDRNSTNGTWVEGERVTEGPLAPAAVLRLGQQGPEFALVLQAPEAELLDRTLEISAATVAKPGGATSTHEERLAAAVHHARWMRGQGVGGETMTIMRNVLDEVLRHTYRRHRTMGMALLAALLVVSGFAIWKTVALDHEKRAIDRRIQEMEAALQNAKGGAETEHLISRLDDYEEQAESLRRSFLYRIGPHDEGDFVTRELREVMATFGAEVYSIPPDFVDRVKHYIDQDTGPDRPNVEHALVERANAMKTIRRILEEEQMPPDLAYIPIVESALSRSSESEAGAVGPWQLTAPTARAYGLRVDAETDERKELVKATRASCRYLKDLILDFGAGSSVMLALAAYNSGGSKVKQAVSRAVQDPIQQRNFWYLYRIRALPLETREFVPKVFAAILIGRNPRHFGF
jgi:pSer/pThr/pTyr-binding forkhead associated (FHA) protein